MNLQYMNTNIEQMKGLMFIKDMPFDLAIVFPFGRTKNIVIHTWFVKFDLDIGMLNEDMRISKLYKDVKPFKIMPVQSCNGFVETRAGAKILNELMQFQTEKDKDADDWKWRK